MSRSATVADPDLDDLDDLDDIVDEFDAPAPPSFQSKPAAAAAPSSSSPAPQPSSSAPTAQIPSSPATKDSTSAGAPLGDGDVPDDKLDDLVEGMVQLLKELEGAGGPDATVGTGASTTTGQPPETTASTDSQGTEGDEDAFQRSIRQAMDRLRSSEANPSPSAGAQTSSEDPLEALLKQFGDALGDGIESGLGGGAEGGETEDAELQGMLETMMRQLMSKDVLYEPLKELSEKFPTYLATNAPTLSVADKERYEQQQIRVHQIVAIFEREDYKEGEEATGDGGMGAEVVRLMNEMQSFGTPPTEIMGPMPPGLEMGTDGAPNLPEGCVIA